MIKLLLLAVLFGLIPFLHGAIPLLTLPLDHPGVPTGELLSCDGRRLASVSTQVFVRRTAKALIYRFECEDTDNEIPYCQCTERDGAVWNDDCVDVFLSSPNMPTYLHFCVNRQGIQYDALGHDSSWNATWTSVCKKTQKGWCAIITIPFDQVGGAPKTDDIWFMNVSRFRHEAIEWSGWAPTGSQLHTPGNFGQLRFVYKNAPTAAAWKKTDSNNGLVSLKWPTLPQDVTLLINDIPQPSLEQAQLNGLAAGNNHFVIKCQTGDRIIYIANAILHCLPLAGALSESQKRLNSLGKNEETLPLWNEWEIIRRYSSTRDDGLAELLSEQAVVLRNRLRLLSQHDIFKKQGHSESAITYAITNTLFKPLRNAPYDGLPGGPLFFDAARREMEAAQIIVYSKDAPLLQLQAKASELAGPDGATLPADVIRIRRAAYIRTANKRLVYRSELSGQNLPDPLLPLTSCDIAAESFEPLWIDVRIPAETVPGKYTGTVTLDALNGEPTSIPLEINVRPFSIPKQLTMRSVYGCSPNWRIKQDRWAFFDNLIEHRCCPTATGPICPEKKTAADGSITWDWTEFDANFEKTLAHGSNMYMVWPSDLLTNTGDFQNHFAEKDWFKYLYTYLDDEPPAERFADVNKTLLKVHELAPDLMNLMTARGCPSEHIPYVDIWCPEMFSYNHEAARQEQERGRMVLWYVTFSCQSPLPSLMIEYPAMDMRIWPWMTWKYKLDGQLLWSVTDWNKNAYAYLDDQPCNGEGRFLYPGVDGKPVDSIRWENLRDGLEDYDIFCLLEAAADELQEKQPELAKKLRDALEIKPEIVNAIWDFTHSYDTLTAARKAHYDLLETAVNSLGHEPAVIKHPVYGKAIPADEIQKIRDVRSE